LGWEVFVDASFAPYLFELLMSGESAVAPSLVGFHAAESLRTEKAFRHWGHDIGYTDTPHESGLMFTCKTKKQGGFKGMEQLEQRVQHSKERVLIQLLLEDPDLFVYHNEPILLNDTIVGSITTGSYGHSLGGPVGLGWIKLDETIDLSLLEQYSFQVLVAGKKIAAKVSLKPMYDPSNLKLRA
jgi:4-methylaminobutanoate oxidase (formaldehyde-forming)